MPTDTNTPLPTQTNTPLPTEEPPATETPEPEPTEDTADSQSSDSTDTSSAYDSALIAQGEALFLACGACHGPDGAGIPNLGKSLIDSEFVDGLTDDELVDFIKVGRPMWDPENTTGIDMPAKGGNPALSDDEIFAIVAYIRSLGTGSNDESATADTTSADTSDGVQTETSDYDSDLITQGEALFLACGACHGPDGAGIPNLGKSLIDSEFVDGLTDDELVDFIKVGRPMWDPENTTGIDMPAKGGNPALSDDEIFAIVAYVRSLNQ